MKPLLALLLLAVPLDQADPVLSSRETQQLGKAIAGYFTSLDEDQGSIKALDGVLKVMKSLQKKHKVDDLLSLPYDWQGAFELAMPYAKTGLRKARVVEGEMGGSQTFGYQVRLPKSYKADKAWPLVLYLVPNSAYTDLKDALGQAAKETDAFEELILIAPRLSNESEWTESIALGSALSPLGSALMAYHADHDRIHMVAAPGTGVLAMRLAVLFPGRFASVSFLEEPGDCASPANLSNLAVLAGGAGAAALEGQMGEAAGRLEVRDDPPADLASVWSWAVTQVRNSYPTRVTYRMAEPVGREAFWVRAAAFDWREDAEVSERPGLTAEVIDRSRIVLDCQGITAVNVYLSDALLDLDKPITIEANGSVWTGQVERNVEKALQLVYRSNDTRFVYANSQYIEVPEKSDD